MSIVIRGLAEEDLPAMRRVADLAFASTTPEEQWTVIERVVDVSRSIGGFDGPSLVGQAGITSLALALPGGTTTRAAGVTAVAVAPTHRRQGILNRLMRTQLDDLHENGEALAVLWSSEPDIYGRFGYGPATRQISLKLPRSARSSMRPSLPEATTLHRELRDIDEASLELCAEAYQRAAATRPGMPSRTPSQWAHDSYDGNEVRDGGSALRCLVVSDDSGPAGYSWYRTRIQWSGARPNGKVIVGETVGATLGAERDMLGFLLDVDLTEAVSWWNVPTDHPVTRLVPNLRSARPTLVDQLWARPVRVGEVLSQRRYRTAVDVVIDVVDEVCPWNQRRWRLAGDPSGAMCTTTPDPPDLRMDVRDLATVVLGEDSLPALGRAGLAEELTPGALEAAAAGMTSSAAPWCPFVF